MISLCELGFKRLNPTAVNFCNSFSFQQTIKACVPPASFTSNFGSSHDITGVILSTLETQMTPHEPFSQSGFPQEEETVLYAEDLQKSPFTAVLFMSCSLTAADKNVTL